MENHIILTLHTQINVHHLFLGSTLCVLVHLFLFCILSLFVQSLSSCTRWNHRAGTLCVKPHPTPSSAQGPTLRFPPCASWCVNRPKSHTKPFKITPWCVKPPKSHTNPAKCGVFAEDPRQSTCGVWLSPQCPTLDRAAPSSRERLSLRDGYFGRRLFCIINWCRAPATPKPGPLLNRSLDTSLPIPRGQRSGNAHAPR